MADGSEAVGVVAQVTTQGHVMANGAYERTEADFAIRRCSSVRNNLTLGRQALLSCLQRTAILTSDKFKGVRLNLDPGSLRVASTNAEQEEAVDELDIDYEGDSIEIGFNVTYLIDALTNMSQEMVTLEFSDGNSSALITIPENDNFKYVVMPMRI